MSGAAVDVHGVSVRYGSVAALDSVDLVLGAGAVCGLIGMNGSGKSSLIKALMGIVPVHQGRVLLNGRTPRQARRQAAVAYVPQAEEVDWSFPISVRDVVSSGRYGRLRWTRRLTQEDRDAVDEAMRRVGVTDLADRPIGALSGGQRQRTFVARAVAQQAGVLLLDEPFAGVDEPSERMISALLRELAAAECTILIATHDLHALPDLCTEAVLLARRRVVLHAAPEMVLRPENLALAFGLLPAAANSPMPDAAAGG